MPNESPLHNLIFSHRVNFWDFVCKEVDKGFSINETKQKLLTIADEITKTDEEFIEEREKLSELLQKKIISVYKLQQEKNDN